MPDFQKGNPDFGLRSEVRKRKIAGESYAAIGKAFGFSRQRAQQILIATENAASANKCDACGCSDKPLHRHHSDYSQDYDLNLCPECHTKWHCKAKREMWLSINRVRLDLLKAKLLGLDFVTAKLASELSGLSLKFCSDNLTGLVKHRLAKSKYPWHQVDWSCTNREIAGSFRIPLRRVCNFRSRYRLMTRKYSRAN